MATKLHMRGSSSGRSKAFRWTEGNGANDAPSMDRGGPGHYHERGQIQISDRVTLAELKRLVKMGVIYGGLAIEQRCSPNSICGGISGRALCKLRGGSFSQGWQAMDLQATGSWINLTGGAVGSFACRGCWAVLCCVVFCLCVQISTMQGFSLRGPSSWAESRAGGVLLLLLKVPQGWNSQQPACVHSSASKKL